MTEMTQAQPTDSLIRAAGGFAIVSGIVSAIGVVFFIGMYSMFMSSNQALGLRLGMINDICVAIQYLLAIPIALALFRILSPFRPGLVGTATIIGVVGLVATVGLQLLLIFGVLTFEQQLPWISLSILAGIGSWLVITGIVARATGRLPNSVLMSAIAVPYFGYPVWAFWLGIRLIGW